MKRFLVLSLLLFLVAAGCSQQPTEQVSSNPLDQPFGGFTTDNEAPAFGDAALLAAADGEVSVDDPLVAAINADDSVYAARYTVFALRVVWGQPRLDTLSTTPTTWDGSLAVDSGRIGVLRTIRFEPGQDHLVLPRTAPNEVEWVSVTTVHNDGLLLLIGMPTALLADSASNMITFATAPLTYSFEARDLYALDTAIAVGDAGNMVMFNSFVIDRRLCPRGFLEGGWAHSDSADGGRFRGRWMSRDGRLSGYLQGEYGFRSNGKPVFFGKYIDESGNFEGRLRGVWGPRTGHNRGGFFRGLWYDAMDRPAGRLHGHWKAEEDGKGTFQGVWKTKCFGWDDSGHEWRDWEDEWWNPGWIDHPMPDSTM